jgi:hypothetical protein
MRQNALPLEVALVRSTSLEIRGLHTIEAATVDVERFLKSGR